MRRLTIAGAIALTSIVLFDSCSKGSENNAKFNQYYHQGELLYTRLCSNCHQKDGTGLGRVYPPLNESDYMKNKFEDVLCLIRFGKSGPLTVNGLEFNQIMPGNEKLTDLEVAEISTYIYNNWSHKRGLISVTEVTPRLAKCERE